MVIKGPALILPKVVEGWSPQALAQYSPARLQERANGMSTELFMTHSWVAARLYI